MRLASSRALFLLIVLVSCGETGPAPAAPTADVHPDRLVVITVNYPLAYFAERLGGDEVAVIFHAPADEDPAFWSPGPAVIATYQEANLILLNGAGYAKWVERATLPTSNLVDTSAGFTDRYIKLADTVTHSHGPEGDHEHGGWAFTTWLDPTLAMEQARAVAAALQHRLPESSTAIDQRLAVLETDLATLDARFAAAAGTIGSESILFSHPVYQYFIARYDLNGKQVHWEPDFTPDGAMWSELDHILDHDRARWMLWEGEPLAETVAALEERGIASLVFSPCANRPHEGDWLTVMTVNAAALESIASSSAGSS